MEINIIDEIKNIPGGENLEACYQCGTCSSACPVIKLILQYNIRKIIKSAIDGTADLNNKYLWFCSTCYLCYERCPQDVKPTYIVHALTNIISRQGLAPEALKAGVQTILSSGRSNVVADSTQKKRKALKLPELKPDISSDFKKIAELTGLINYAEKK